MKQALSLPFHLLFVLLIAFACKTTDFNVNTKILKIGKGWAKTSINAPIFRKNSVVSSANYQFVAYYNTLLFF